ncbi:hypothetical protein NHX12_032417 [Muraenolepis orangiensis]|uniref:Uncharacterized protein n=1 Tax=Muraenolepis orangiensis TaxID=630683 RepID=A0A9Q0IJU7_9TELE|nr:hypothetical protein NHX12_032417 [Muraenolepis orangiensis]
MILQHDDSATEERIALNLLAKSIVEHTLARAAATTTTATTTSDDDEGTDKEATVVRGYRPTGEAPLSAGGQSESWERTSEAEGKADGDDGGCHEFPGDAPAGTLTAEGAGAGLFAHTLESQLPPLAAHAQWDRSITSVIVNIQGSGRLPRPDEKRAEPPGGPEAPGEPARSAAESPPAGRQGREGPAAGTQREKVTVTKVTINSVTVTFKEAMVAEGFFRGH